MSMMLCRKAYTQHTNAQFGLSPIKFLQQEQNQSEQLKSRVSQVWLPIDMDSGLLRCSPPDSSQLLMAAKFIMMQPTADCPVALSAFQ